MTTFHLKFECGSVKSAELEVGRLGSGSYTALPALNPLPIQRVHIQAGTPCRSSLARWTQWVNGDPRTDRLAVALSGATASISSPLTSHRPAPAIMSLAAFNLHGTGVENGKPAQDQRFENSEEFAPELLRAVETITQTEQTRFSTLLAVANGGNAPKGLGTDGNKPLMRNRARRDCASATGHTASNNLPPGCETASYRINTHPRVAGWRRTAAKLSKEVR